MSLTREYKEQDSFSRIYVFLGRWGGVDFMMLSMLSTKTEFQNPDHSVCHPWLWWLINSGCHPDWTEGGLRHWESTLLHVSVRVFQRTGRWVSKWVSGTCPECGWHHSKGWGPRWNKGAEGRSCTLSSRWVPFSAAVFHADQTPGLLAFEPLTLQGAFRLRCGWSLHTLSFWVFLDWAANGFPGSVTCRWLLWDCLGSDWMSQPNKLLL